MGYPTDVRAKRAEYVKGIWCDWTEHEDPLPAYSEVTIISVTGKAGKLKVARLFSMSPWCWLEITLDGVDFSHTKDSPASLYNSYGCSGEHGGWKLALYDTVASKYVIETVQELEFGNSMVVKMKNDGGSAVRCFGDVVYVVNS